MKIPQNFDMPNWIHPGNISSTFIAIVGTRSAGRETVLVRYKGIVFGFFEGNWRVWGLSDPLAAIEPDPKGTRPFLVSDPDVWIFDMVHTSPGDIRSLGQIWYEQALAQIAVPIEKERREKEAKRLTAAEESRARWQAVEDAWLAGANTTKPTNNNQSACLFC